MLCDGTSVNTGSKTGMICNLERMLRKNLLWLVCQLHGNELPLRHVFDYLDGGMGPSGPNSFKGPLGIACSDDNIHKKTVSNFSRIPSTLTQLPESVRADLSRDQALLHEYASCIITKKTS